MGSKVISYSIIFFLTFLVTYNLINISSLNIDMSYYTVKPLKDDTITTLLAKNPPTNDRYNLYEVLGSTYRNYELYVGNNFPLFYPPENYSRLLVA